MRFTQQLLALSVSDAPSLDDSTQWKGERRATQHRRVEDLAVRKGARVVRGHLCSVCQGRAADLTSQCEQVHRHKGMVWNA
eukprot:scaffold42802_cov31-Tisochrysis_lutea.AAC.2